MKLPDLNGRVAWVFAQENFDVDQIVGVKNIKITDIGELAALAMQSFDPDFSSQVTAGDVLVGGSNFGYGHPHYPPMMAMRELGVTAVIAESFAPGFFRGETSMGFPLLTCPGILQTVSRWDVLSVDWDGNTVHNQSTGLFLPMVPFEKADRALIAHGGLIEYLKLDSQTQKNHQETFV